MLVTGAGGFVGGHVARELAAAGHRVIGLTRRQPLVRPGDPPIEWQLGDLRDPVVRKTALRGNRAVIHAASWVSLGPDLNRQADMINIEVTRALLVEAAEAGVARLVYTSTLHTLATGSADNPANEDAPWNLHAVDSPYARTKREAERIVLDGLGGRLETVVLCPGMVIGPRAERPTSTRLILSMARCPVVTMPPGGIPIVDAGVLAKAHRLALCRGEPGQRYALVGPYLSYVEMARLVARVSCRPWWVRELPDQAQRPMTRLAQILERHAPSLGRHLNQATVAGGFLRLRVRGDRADEVFELIHPPPLDSIRDCLRDAWKSGQAPWLRLRPDPE